ncbi:MAG: hypothetical protein EP347_09520 [Alphaproteobacteria bacterium]|nr:MAG: hypothetical protein EP347_09520 [Alphaproteobacteria bacterium]
MKNIMKALVLILLAGVLVACYPESKYPLSSPEISVVDEDLIGLWYGGEEGDPSEHSYYAFLQIDDDRFDIIGLNFNDTKDEWIRMSAFTTEIGGSKFMSITFEDESGVKAAEAEDADEPRNYLLCRYEVSGDSKLTVYLMDEEAMLAALAAQTSAATNNNWLDNDGRITAPTEVLRSVIASSDATLLFNDVFGVYERRT